jgi:hypothetical protein
METRWSLHGHSPNRQAEKSKTIADSPPDALLPFPVRREPVLSQPATGQLHWISTLIKGMGA